MKQMEVVNYCNELLSIANIKDFCPNGLQIEGDNRSISKIVTGVSISLELIEKAIDVGADLILTHHGMFWDKDSRVIQGPLRKKIHKLLQSGIATASYHLPLDYHSELGNNIQLAQRLGLKNVEHIPDGTTLAEAVSGTTDPTTIEAFAAHIESTLCRKPVVLPFGNEMVSKIVIITGGAQNYFMTAVAEGADCFITGEISEKNYAMSQEYQIHFISAGHYATERCGIQALGNHLQEKFGMTSEFIDVPNPI